VILTTGAVQVLDPAQLDAVLAHERAHLTSHYHRLVAMARIGRQVLPFLPLMRDAEAQVARLAEMHADDAATRVSDPRSLATAWSFWPRPAIPLPPSPRLPPTRCSGYTVFWAPPSHRAARPPAAAPHHRRRARPDASTAGAGPSRTRTRPRPAPDCLAGQHNLPASPVAPAVQHDSWPATPLARAAQPVLFRCAGRQQRRPGSRQ
jgi:hypothetical protein